MSLRLRLGLWYGVLTGLMVLVVTMLTYAEHTRVHYDEMDRTITGVTGHMAREYASASLASNVTTLLSTGVQPGMVARVYTADGRVVEASAGAQLAPDVDPAQVSSSRPYDWLASLAPSLYQINETPGKLGLIAGADGSRWRVYVYPLSNQSQTLVALAPLSRVDASVARLRQLIPLSAIGGALITLLLGWLIAGRALRPVASMTETAGTIARLRAFSQRIAVPASRQDELSRLARIFNGMLESLEYAYRSQQRFVSDASHELRAPLTVIQANLEFLAEQAELTEIDRKELVDESRHEAQRLARLVGDLLMLARADAGLPLHHARVELDRVLLEALRDARHLTDGQHLEVGKLEPTIVDGDADRLKELLLILIDNAIKYTPPDGQITLSLERRPASASLSVRDTGVGIAPEDLPLVFERFYRADPARSRDPGGTGLGLAIARWIVDQHHGEITLASTLGTGTTVTVELPRTDIPGRRNPGGPTET